MIQKLRKEFFAYRNGVVAERLRAAGDPHSVIMGCQLADVIAIANHYEKNALLAQALWDSVNHRECRLAAPMLYPTDEMTIETATAWCHSVESTEIADVLCHRLLRHLPCGQELWESLRSSHDSLVQYTAWRLLLNRLMMGKTEKTSLLRSLVEQEITTAHSPNLQVLQLIMAEM